MSEFARPYRLDAIGERSQMLELEASADERAALAKRFGLVEIARLHGDAALARSAAGIEAVGRLHADVTQSCVASGAPVTTAIDEPFALCFVPAHEIGGGDEIELGADDLDVIAHDGQAIDLGEALAQTLALALDPFPRAPGADAVLKEAGVISEEEAGPFGALAGLRDTLAKNQP